MDEKTVFAEGSAESDLVHESARLACIGLLKDPALRSFLVIATKRESKETFTVLTGGSVAGGHYQGMLDATKQKFHEIRNGLQGDSDD